ncbi:MAG TPA: holdfast anchoring protein HfaA [Caulobacteraceae bacterium]|jgi:holdfast attachment protein HfaA
MALIAVPLTAGLAMLAATAQAQTINTNSASFNAGFGRTPAEENGPVDVQLTDINGNLVVVNGQVTSAAAGSIFASAGAVASASGIAGAADSFSGAGGASASAIGNNLSVVTEGNNNTVIVNSVQSNTGNVTATTNVNGKP